MARFGGALLILLPAAFAAKLRPGNHPLNLPWNLPRNRLRAFFGIFPPAGVSRGGSGLRGAADLAAPAGVAVRGGLVGGAFFFFGVYALSSCGPSCSNRRH